MGFHEEKICTMLPISYQVLGGRRRRMVVGFTTTCVISDYHHKRNSLFRNLFQLLNNRPSEDLLLFGSPDVDIDSNIIVFMTVHKYISQSKRFS